MAVDAPDDLTKLGKLSETSVIEALKARLMQDTIYTAVNAMIVAVNPCTTIEGMYSDATQRRYLSSAPDLPPHVYLTAARVHRGVVQGRSQSVVISGESGAGKTESFKRVIQFISLACSPAQAPRGPAAGRSIDQLLVETVGLRLSSFPSGFPLHPARTDEICSAARCGAQNGEPLEPKRKLRFLAVATSWLKVVELVASSSTAILNGCMFRAGFHFFRQIARRICCDH